MLPGTFILDVRTPEEYGAGHLKGAVLIPVAELERRFGELPQDAGQPMRLPRKACGRGGVSATFV